MDEVRNHIEDCPHPLFHYTVGERDLSLCKLPELHQKLISEDQVWEVMDRVTGDIERFASFRDAEKWIAEELNIETNSQGGETHG